MSLPTMLASLLAALFLSAGGAASAAGNRFCGGAATPGDPSDLANVVGDQTLEYAIAQPANIVTCAKGYLLEKCGDHESANKVFDKCIAAGYAGAMIWKALLLEDGAGVAQDSAKAAELLHRAALSGDPSYSRIGKMHYATALQLGRGVQKNEAEARKWFQAAAAEGSAEAAEFLRTGYHTGHREQNALGAGTPTAAALAGGPTGDNASLPRHAPESPAGGEANAARQLARAPAPVPRPSPVQPASVDAATRTAEAEVQGQKLDRREPAVASAVSPGLPAASAGLGLLLVASFLAGIVRQKRQAGGSGAGQPAL